MANQHVLVFGATGPAGICLLRELLYRQHPTIAYVRNPSKIPEDLVPDPLLTVVKGEITNVEKLSDVVSQSSVIVSLLGPNKILGLDPAMYTGFYERLFPIMKQQNVKRIFAMSTISVFRPEDHFSLIRLLLVSLVFIVVNRGWQTARGIARSFEEYGDGIDWTVYRVAGIPGGSDEKSWKEDREDGEAYEGPIGANGWKSVQRRGALARWLVDAVEDGKSQWIGKLPAVSRLAGSKRKAD
ncbi:hypothetical protein jhhlp_002897 [Lomentospora prolificans]|uniref:NAD(P)-binding domain-containing protein n=1 Tax=Lomentospora prolificans TaxID=41688 RepID=A0A2N3NF76_9PEZI|nr:hypothetical protein jhhlp_002897 [Lomentospora prolificans]